MFIYSVKDAVIGQFMTPAIYYNDAQAKRDFALAINEPNTELYRKWKDMDFYKLGEYNEKTGEIISKVEFLCNGADFKQEVK